MAFAVPARPYRLRARTAARRRSSSSTCSATSSSRAASARPRQRRVAADGDHPDRRGADRAVPGAAACRSSTPARRTGPTSPTARRPSARAAAPGLRIGDAGADGPHPDRRRAGQPDRRRARAARRRDRHRQARQGHVLGDRRCSETLPARGITQLVFAGVTTEVCVQTSMREANDRGYECLLVEDATESYFPEFKAATHRDDRGAGRHRRLDRRRSPRSKGRFRRRWSVLTSARGLSPEHGDRRSRRRGRGHGRLRCL